MSAAWLKLIAIFCLSCAALSGSALRGPEGGGVIYKDIGESFTIQCRSTDTDEEWLKLKKGLEESDVLVKESNSDSSTISKEFSDRLQFNGKFPNIDIHIKNVSFSDMGPYWCTYSKFVQKTSEMRTEKRIGSVLLVVTDAANKGRAKQCETEHKDLILGAIVISAAVLLGIVVVFFVWIVKRKAQRSTVKPRCVPTNDVYEDMRGTLRR